MYDIDYYKNIIDDDIEMVNNEDCLDNFSIILYLMMNVNDVIGEGLM